MRASASTPSVQHRVRPRSRRRWSSASAPTGRPGREIVAERGAERLLNKPLATVTPSMIGGHRFLVSPLTSFEIDARFGLEPLNAPVGLVERRAAASQLLPRRRRV